MSEFNLEAKDLVHGKLYLEERGGRERFGLSKTGIVVIKTTRDAFWVRADFKASCKFKELDKQYHLYLSDGVLFPELVDEEGCNIYGQGVIHFSNDPLLVKFQGPFDYRGNPINNDKYINNDKDCTKCNKTKNTEERTVEWYASPELIQKFEESRKEVCPILGGHICNLTTPSSGARKIKITY